MIKNINKDLKPNLKMLEMAGLDANLQKKRTEVRIPDDTLHWE